MRGKSTSLWAVLFTMVGLFALIASGLPQRQFTAVKIGDEKYNVAEYHIYYYDEYYQYLRDHADEDLTSQGLYSNSRLHRQDSPYGMTWGDYFKKNAEAKMEERYVLVHAAESADYSLSEAGQEKLEAEHKGIQAATAASGLNSEKDYLQHIYQPGVTTKAYYEQFERGLLADEYKNLLIQEKFMPTQQEIEEYAEAHESGDAYTADIILIELEAPFDRFSTEVEQTQLANLKIRTENIMTAFQQNGGTQQAFEELARDFSGKSTASDAIKAKETGDATSTSSSTSASADAYLAAEAAGKTGASGDADSVVLHDLEPDDYEDVLSDWYSDPSRQEGDTTVIYKDNKAYIVYYVQKGTEERLVKARRELISNAYNAWLQEQESKVTVEENFFGMRLAR